jgi:hypothetical protein
MHTPRFEGEGIDAWVAVADDEALLFNNTIFVNESAGLPHPSYTPEIAVVQSYADRGQ